MLPRPFSYIALRTTILFGGVLSLAFLMRVPSLYEPRWYRDEGIFASVATNLRQGELLYADAWDNKPPLIFYTYAAIQSVFGTGVFALHAVTLVAVLFTLCLVMLIALRLYGALPAAVAGLVFTLTTSTPLFEGNLAMTEIFMILPTTAAVSVFVSALHREEHERWPWLLAVGALLGIATNFKQVALFDALAVAVMVWLVYKHPVRPTIVFGLGFALPHMLFAVYFLATGAWNEYWYAVAGSLPLYNDLGSGRGPALRFATLLPALLVTFWLVGRRRHGTDIDGRFFPPLWLAFAIAGATSSALAFPHYLLQAAPAFALTIGGISQIWPRPPVERLALTLAGGVALGVVLGQFAAPIQERQQLHPLAYYRNFGERVAGDRSRHDYEHFFDGSVESVRDIAASIEADGAGDTAYAWSELPWLFAAGDLQNPTRYYTSFLGEIVPDAKPEMLADLDRSPPAYIVVSDNAYAPFGELERWMEGRYVLLTRQNDWRLYRSSALDGELEPDSAAADVQSP